MSGQSSWRERRDFHPGDERLRKVGGFHIHARPKDKTPTWERAGQLYSQEEAEAICDRREQEGK